MKKRVLALVLVGLTACVLMSCNNTKTPKELFEEQQSGVCMVLNTYYYQISLPNGTTWYCTGVDEDGDIVGLTTDRDEILKNRVMATGTAFFIDERGTLMTNRHVVNPELSEATIKRATSSVLSSFEEYVKEIKYQCATAYDELEEEKEDCYYRDFWGDWKLDREAYSRIVEQQNELSDYYDQAQEHLRTLKKMDKSMIEVTPVSEIGIAFNDTYVTNIDDFLKTNPCVVTKVSKDEDTDLALIQLKNKVTPEGKYTFKIYDKETVEQPNFIKKLFGAKANNDLEIGQELVMIGFNAGIILANTSQGIQAQMTIGNVSRNPDGKQLLYSIPTIQGSSGSPVIDSHGYVRAVNYAKLQTSDPFNFGIPEELIHDFMGR